MNKKQEYWKSGNIIVTQGDLYPEYYIIRDDGLAYPCNRKLNEWWKSHTADEYDDELKSVLPDCIRKYWDVIVVYMPVRRPADMSLWMPENIGETRGGLFYSFGKERAEGVNNDCSFLDKEDYNSDLSCNMKNRTSWDFVRVYEKVY